MPHPKIKNIFGVQLIGTVDAPRDGVKSWNAKQLTDACFQSSMFFYPNEAVTNWCTLMSSGEEKHGALKKQKCVWFCIVKCQVKTPDTITALSRKISLVRWQLLR